MSILYLKCMYQYYRLFSGLVRSPTPHLTPHRTLFSDDNFLLPTLPREIVPPPKTGISPRRTISRQGGTISRESRGQPLLSLLHTKTATPLQYEKLSPLFAVRDIVPPSLFPPGGTISRGSEGGTISRGRVGTVKGSMRHGERRKVAYRAPAAQACTLPMS